MNNVRRELNFDMHEQYSETSLEHFKKLAEKCNNFKLFNINKPSLIQICIHYGISQQGTKIVLQNRIIQHRDTLFLQEIRERGPIHDYIGDNPLDSVPPFVTDETKQKIYKFYKFYNNRITLHSILNLKKKIKKDSKINLIIIYHKFLYMNDPNTTHTIESLYIRNSTLINSRETIIGAIMDQCNPYEQNIRERNREINEQNIRERNERILRANPPDIVNPLNPVDTRKKIEIQNLTSQIVYVYFTEKRVDCPDYSDCHRLFDLPPGVSKVMLYSKDTTNVIISKSLQGRICYYLDLKDDIISEKVTGGTNGSIEIKEDKRELEQWKESALKCDFLIKQLKRLGIDKNENYSAIIDMHEDINIPEHSERDKELAGIPSVFTNVT